MHSVLETKMCKTAFKSAYSFNSRPCSLVIVFQNGEIVEYDTKVERCRLNQSNHC